MFMFRTLSAVALLSSLLLSGCTSQVTKSEQYSGFLADYSNLNSIKSPTGETVLRWMDPDFKLSHYSGIYYQPVNFYPQPQPSARISQSTLQGVLNYTNEQLSAAMAKKLPLVRSSGPRTLIFRGAITGVDAKNEGLKAYEVIPIALVVAGTMSATGHRDQNTELYFEGEFIDGASGQPVLRVLRKGFGVVLKNDKQAVTLDDLKPVINNMAKDVSLFP